MKIKTGFYALLSHENSDRNNIINRIEFCPFYRRFSMDYSTPTRVGRRMKKNKNNVVKSKYINKCRI